MSVDDLVPSIAGLRERLLPLRRTGSIGFVPTMGALHEGHARLIDRARGECATVVVSIFVNPLQFDRPDDLANYPKTLDTDLELCRAHGVDLVFAPSAPELYPQPPLCTVHIDRLAAHLCGRYRPGHFAGVATVVLKLLAIVQPDRAYFGEKDAQQLAIVKRLVFDFNLPVEVVPVPTVRAADGLAISSRNHHLDTRGRALAPGLYRALREADRRITAGDRDVAAIVGVAKEQLPRGDDVRLEYLEIVDPADMQPVSSVNGPVRIAGALWVGNTRLIDNVLSTPPTTR
jgi:pantoate--beta-alanine ligase